SSHPLRSSPFRPLQRGQAPFAAAAAAPAAPATEPGFPRDPVARRARRQDERSAIAGERQASHERAHAPTFVHCRLGATALKADRTRQRSAEDMLELRRDVARQRIRIPDVAGLHVSCPLTHRTMRGDDRVAPGSDNRAHALDALFHGRASVHNDRGGERARQCSQRRRIGCVVGAESRNDNVRVRRAPTCVCCQNLARDGAQAVTVSGPQLECAQAALDAGAQELVERGFWRCRRADAEAHQAIVLEICTRQTPGPCSRYSQPNSPVCSYSNWYRSGRGSWSFTSTNDSPGASAENVWKIVGCFSRGGMTRTSSTR